MKKKAVIEDLDNKLNVLSSEIQEDIKKIGIHPEFLSETIKYIKEKNKKTTQKKK